MKISITGTGSHNPSQIVKNDSFLNHEFLDMDGSAFDADNEIIIEKFKAITGIKERKYAAHNLNTSDLGVDASKQAIADAGIDPEELDYIIFAHNFGDVTYGQNQSDTLPSLATRVKHGLKIKNPNCVAYDVLYGCPGWIEGMIQAYAFIKAGMAKKCLVIGGETLSRVVDPYDRDAMIYADGAGATIVEATEDGGEYLATGSQTFAYDESKYLFFGVSYNQENTKDQRYIKMYGRKIYEFAVTHVPAAIKAVIDKSGVDILDVKKIFIHQANEKMDDAIIKRLYRLYKMKVPEGIMPMNIQTYGNSSVATVPTLFDLVRKNKVEGHTIQTGDICVFASVGAGMNINAIVYKF